MWQRQVEEEGRHMMRWEYHSAVIWPEWDWRQRRDYPENLQNPRRSLMYGCNSNQNGPLVQKHLIKSSLHGVSIKTKPNCLCHTYRMSDRIILKLSRYLENWTNNIMPTFRDILFSRYEDTNVWSDYCIWLRISASLLWCSLRLRPLSVTFGLHWSLLHFTHTSNKRCLR